MTRLPFEVLKTAQNSKARLGKMQTLHSEVETPIFMPVGTQATVKNQRFSTLESLDARILLTNTFHLLLRPGLEIFEKLGGVHRFTGWERSFLTDSGGFQIFSLPESRRLTDDFAEFKSYVDGSKIRLSPEQSIQAQRAIGSDIWMVLDECVPSTSERQIVVNAMERTRVWAGRSFVERGDSPQALFGIVQGACFKDLRKTSAEQITEIDFDGFAIGGLAVGEPREERQDITEWTTEFLPKDRPRYLMGVGTPIDLLEAVHRGVDMFDCTLPTLMAQRGVVYTSQGRVELRRGVHKTLDIALDPECPCDACTRHSRAYLHHLVNTAESLAWQLLGEHNLTFYMNLMKKIRWALREDRFLEFYQEWKPILESRDLMFPVTHPKRLRHVNNPAGSARQTDSPVHEPNQL